MSNVPSSVPATKAAWIEPTVIDLDVDETKGLPTRGADFSIHADCTRS